MLGKEAIEELEKQQYRIVGNHKHSAVKVCGWTKNMIRGKGGCYKLKFYGIMSNQCLQMSTSISCANRCTFCWRGYKAPVSKDWKWGIDEPQQVIDESLQAHEDLLNGFKGSKTANMNLYEQSKTVRHVALSLTGEPIIYPRINEAIDIYHNQNISTFMVTNAQYADQIRDLKPVTQLYVSIDAPNKALLKEIDVPLFTDYWERMNASLDYLRAKQARTTIRLTMIKDQNMIEPENYAKLILKGNPDFVEIKAYMFVGASRQRLSLKNMPYHEEVKDFAQEVLEHLPGYSLADEHKPSRVVLLAKNEYYDDDNKQWRTWIDFEAFFKQLEENPQAKDLPAHSYGVRWTQQAQHKELAAKESSPDEVDLEKEDC